jgi:hypothetical protein
MESKPYRPAVRELAARIYTQLVTANPGDAAAALAAAPECAHASFRLAEAFQAVEDELNAANLPKNAGFKLEAADIAEWTKK